MILARTSPMLSASTLQIVAGAGLTLIALPIAFIVVGIVGNLVRRTRKG